MNKIRSKTKVFYFHDNLYDEETFVLYDCTWREANAWARKQFKGLSVDIIENGDYVSGLCTSIGHNKTMYYVVWIKNSCCPRTVAHELTHLCTRILLSRGIHIELHSNEALAYYMGMWMEMFVEHAVKSKKKGGKKSGKKESSKR